MPVPRPILEQLKYLIPPLNGSLRKGQSGRVGVLGGALDYTGAPFFAAMSALRLGADLSHVICSPTAAGAIKSYSPDLIVHPILCQDRTPEQIKPALNSLIDRLHVLVVGPGLGREPYMGSFATLALRLARSKGIFVVLDADALWMVANDFSIIRGYRRAVLTPNFVEFQRLREKLELDHDVPSDKLAGLVSKALGGVTVLEKGAKDIAAVNATREMLAPRESQQSGGSTMEADVIETVEIDVEGGLKRCGGQGDILSGCVGTFLAWGKCYENGFFGEPGWVAISRVPLLAAIGGSMVTRTASRQAFLREGRSVVTEDMIPEIRKAFTVEFGEDSQSRVGKL